MSWSAYSPEPVSAEDAELSVDLTNVTFVDDAQKKATQDQVKAAHRAVKELIKAVGGKKDMYYVNIAGHANPNHEPMDGWSNDHITITVSQVPVAE